ncbi:steroid 21-hydroxylase [Anolis carolinensis]|uniref:Steroid 21-hydroxylase n=1 Tax=Anolis carolinensis TaxID=28377 RepID=G1KPD5_ANOCA|nr:PREDICTED: steroid 21-hydroxylase [Anolis carolinensis]|eukprot:XP_003218107.2 PREDICTED: steroid 21-hydroxylase [Anolis carolinensis]
MLSALLFVVVLLAIALLSRWHPWHCQGKDAKDLPGPRALPLIGNLSHMFQPNLPIHFLQLAHRYGPIYRLRLGNKDVVVLNSLETIREALIRKWSDFAGRPHSFITNLISMGGKDLSLGDYTPTWRLQRKLTHMAFQRCRQGDMEQIVHSQAQHLCKVFRSYGGEPVDVAHDFSMHACSVISTMLFGPLDMPSIEKMHDCMLEMVKAWNALPIRVLDFWPILKIFPNPSLRHLLSCLENRDDVVQGQMAKHQKSDHSPEEQDMLDHMLHFLHDHDIKKWGDTGLLPDHVHMAVVDLVTGGTETTATLLTWAVAFLLHCPQIQELIHKELMTVVGPHRDPTYSDREHLPYLNATIWEALRMRPSAPLALPHMTIRDTSVAGFSIPKGTTVIPNLYGAHQDPSKWPNPQEFRPERFLEGQALAEAQRHLVPFSCGARVCLGEALARMEAFLFLAYILRDFQILPSPSGSLPDLQPHCEFLMFCKPFMARLVPWVENGSAE